MLTSAGREIGVDEIEVVIGVDAHKRTHTLVAADELGREMGQKTVAATSDGHMIALAWAARWPGRRWAVEDCRHLTRTLERDLLSVVLSDVLCEVGVTDAARGAGRGHRDQAEDQVQRG